MGVVRRPLPSPRQGRRLGPPEVWNVFCRLAISLLLFASKSNCFLLAFKPAVCQSLNVSKAAPRPLQWLLMGVQACRLPGLKPLKRLKRLTILLARPTPQATGTPRPHQWHYGRSSLPFASLSTLQMLQKPLGTPNRAGKS